MPVTRSVRWAGVKVWEDRLLDGALSAMPRVFDPVDIPKYEDALVDGLHTMVTPGDRVVLIGGGFGVTAVVAARAAGSAGVVWCFEASAEQLDWIRRTYALNARTETLAPLRLVHGVVGTPHRVYGGSGDARTTAPPDLPECDVIELDCEGSEIEIIEQMRIKPRAILVESHGIYGSPTDAVRHAVEGAGYEVLSVRAAEGRWPDRCFADDVRVIAAMRRGGDTRNG